MGVSLHRRLGKTFDRTEISSFGAFVLAVVPSIALGLFVASFAHGALLNQWGPGILESLVSAVFVAVVMSVTYFAGLLVLRNDTAAKVLAPFRNRGGNRA
jgi:hypothetical protein